ncbi:EmrB/QacA subfamily drug resistance transporter [Streptacidiphilus sp. MAP12-16]|uniref:MFS transporter n=1 Tax=Streptacidiphilus sp. MAP12-16 TaxID=3156300 RepID=UPI00351200B0
MMSSAAQDRRAAPADRRWLVLVVVAVAQLMVVLDATVVNIALPSAQHALGFSNTDRQWVVTCYALAFGSLLLLGGRIGDMFSRKRVLIAGLAGFAVASAIGGAAVSFPMLVTARTLQGVFAALLAPAALGTLTSTFTDPRERGRAFAVFGSVASGGAGVGLILGGVLTQYLSWRYTLYVNLVFAAFAIAGALAWIRSSRPATRPRQDWPGTVLASAGLFLIVFGFSRAEIAGWAAPLTVTCLVGGPLLLAAFVAAERRSTHPLMPLRVILDRTRGGSYAVLGLTGIALFGVFLFLTYYLQEVKGYSPVTSGLLFLPFVGGILVSSTESSIVALPRVGPRALIASGMLLGTGAMAYLTQLTVTSSYASVILPAMIVMGLGFGVIFAVTINTATADVRRQDAGVASALVNTMQQVGGSIGLSALSTVALNATTRYLATHHTGPLAPAIAATRGYTTAFAVAAAILGLGVILAVVLLPSRRRLAELRTAAAEPTPAPEPQPAPAPQAIPVALCGCSPVTHPVSGAAVAAGRRIPPGEVVTSP